MLALNILNQFFVYHREPWHDKDWRAASGLPLEDIWFQAADGAKLFALACGGGRIGRSLYGVTAMPATSSSGSTI